MKFAAGSGTSICRCEVRISFEQEGVKRSANVGEVVVAKQKAERSALKYQFKLLVNAEIVDGWSRRTCCGSSDFGKTV